MAFKVRTPARATAPPTIGRWFEASLPTTARFSHLALKTLGLALLVFSVLALTPRQTARAQATVHVVQPGENLFRIGLKYGVSWQSIMQANGLTDTYIYVGQQLIIPGLSAPTPAPVAPTAAPPPIPTTSAPAANPPAPATSTLTYIIRPGDTLGHIAQRFNLSLSALMAANGILNPALIYAGQTLTIPGSVPLGPPPAGNGPKRIEVDISEQHLYAYAGDVLVYSFIASTGEPGRGTATGTYSVLDKIPNAYASLWDLQMPNWLGIYYVDRFENGIHALPILSNGQRLWDGYLGSPVSYGCVIVGVTESQLLYDWAEVGTSVIIRW